jgi:Domain of unknown function (DUF4389)
MRPLRVVLIVIGSLAALIGLAVLAGGATLSWALATQRDDDGFFTTTEERLATETYAITSDEIDLGDADVEEWWAERDLATVKVVAESTDRSRIFVGVASEADVEAYLADVPHDEVSDIDFHPFSVSYRRQNVRGTAEPEPPGDQDFWVARGTGESTQTLTWDLEPGRWAIVLMNADASPDVVADVELGGRIDYLVPIAIGLVAGGVILLGIGAGLIVGGVVAREAPAAVETPCAIATVPPAAVRPSPVRLEGHLDPDLSRWLWVVKWFLAIPHFIVLAFLWVAFAVTTFIAFFAILFTARYPRSIFQFNVGVLRWTWRVLFYATHALGTDRYPPFTLERTDYPATLDVEYPERLSRGLVLVKSWLLAIPQLIIVGALTSAFTIVEGRGPGMVFRIGLLGILILVAGFGLLFTGRYPRGVFDFLLGIDRWAARVIVYVALMTDWYPPFRLDQGATEPGSVDDMPPRTTPWRPPDVTPVGVAPTSATSTDLETRPNE